MENEKQKKRAEAHMILTTRDGWKFGLGFWLAWGAISFVLLPAFVCGAILTFNLLSSFISQSF